MVLSTVERWAEIDGGGYEVSDHGNVRRTSDGRILKPSTGKLGYPRVILHRGGKPQTLLIHHAVAKHFVSTRPDGLVIDHIDGIKHSNHYTNLRYITHAENIRKGYDGKRGDNHHASKLTDAQVAEIRSRRLAGERGSNLAREYGVSQATVCDILKQRSRKEISRGSI